jgi:demethylmenaquinone methyltransferase/2-methoxy-6-polyprenyl-1,4-benzoquinol methylase
MNRSPNSGSSARGKGIAEMPCDGPVSLPECGCWTWRAAPARAIRDVVLDEDLITCLEPSAGMIRESKKTLGCEHIQATAEAMPVPDESFEFLTMGFALRHVDDLDRAFVEYHRVLKPGGKVLVLELTLPESKAARFLLKLYFKCTLPFVVRLFTGKQVARMMWYYWDTMEQVVPPATVVQALQRAGFSKVQRRVSIGLFSEYEAVRGA